MHVIGQDNPGIYFERSFGFRLTDCLPQKVDFPDEQVAVSIRQGHGKEDRDIGEFRATVVGHGRTMSVHGLIGGEGGA